MKNEKEKGGSSVSNVLTVALSFGVGLGLRLLIYVYAGTWLDERLGTEPWFALAGMLIALGMSFQHLFSVLIADNPGGNDEESSEGDQDE